jgi:hypothetical protein
VQADIISHSRFFEVRFGTVDIAVLIAVDCWLFEVGYVKMRWHYKDKYYRLSSGD